VTLTVLQLALVDGPKYNLGAASNYDSNILTAEVEAIGENVNSALANQKVVHKEVGNQANKTQTVVKQSAGERTSHTLLLNKECPGAERIGLAP
jgi:hypothetical protein